MCRGKLSVYSAVLAAVSGTDSGPRACPAAGDGPVYVGTGGEALSADRQTHLEY